MKRLIKTLIADRPCFFISEAAKAFP